MIRQNKIPEEVKSYATTAKSVETAIKSKVLCRVLFLIIDGQPDKKNYNDALAVRYAETRKGKRTPNPKVMAIHLNKLRQAGILKRGDKEGRKQYHEVCWEGLMDIMKFRGLLSSDYSAFSLSYMFYEKSKPFSSDDWRVTHRYGGAAIQVLTKELAERFLKPYFLEYADYLQIGSSYAHIEDGTNKWGVTTVKPKNYDNIDFGILELLQRFDRTLFSSVPRELGGLISKSAQNLNLKKTAYTRNDVVLTLAQNGNSGTSVLYALLCYWDFINHVNKMQLSELPEGLIIDTFARMVKETEKKTRGK